MSLILRVLFVLGLAMLCLAEQEGSGLQCLEEKVVRSGCKDSEKVRLFHFSQSDNRCKAYTTCQLSDGDQLGAFNTIGECEEACPATECLHPPQIENGFYYMSRSEEGTTAHYTCFNSYQLVGPSERKCHFDGSWEGVEPYCELTAITCSPSPEVEGAIKYPSCLTPGCLVVYSCNEEQGWDRVYGKGYRRCGEDGKWMNDVPICARIRVMQDESEVNTEIKATNGQANFEVQCIIEPKMPAYANVQWKRVEGNGEVGALNGITHWLSDTSYALSFDTVNFEDAGKYKCELQLDKVIERSVRFVVISPSNEDTVSMVFAHDLVLPHLIMLTCIFKGTQKPTVDWYFNDQKVIAGDKYIISDQTQSNHEINFSVLEILNWKHEDLARYHCIANQDNSTQEDFDLGEKYRGKRSLDQSVAPALSLAPVEAMYSSSTTICADKTTDVFVGNFRRTLKETTSTNQGKSYVLKAERYLQPKSFVKSPSNNEKAIKVTVQDQRFDLTYLSLRDSFIFVVRTDNSDEHQLMQLFPYSKKLEMIINYACS